MTPVALELNAAASETKSAVSDAIDVGHHGKTGHLEWIILCVCGRWPQDIAVTPAPGANGTTPLRIERESRGPGLQDQKARIDLHWPHACRWLNPSQNVIVVALPPHRQ